MLPLKRRDRNVPPQKKGSHTSVTTGILSSVKSKRPHTYRNTTTQGSRFHDDVCHRAEYYRQKKPVYIACRGSFFVPNDEPIYRDSNSTYHTGRSVVLPYQNKIRTKHQPSDLPIIIKPYSISPAAVRGDVSFCYFYVVPLRTYVVLTGSCVS